MHEPATAYALLIVGLLMLRVAPSAASSSSSNRGSSTAPRHLAGQARDFPVVELHYERASAGTREGTGNVLLQNGFVRAVLTLAPPSLCDLRGDFSGGGHYGKNTLAAAFRLSTMPDADTAAERATLVVVDNSSTTAWVQLLNVTDSSYPTAMETWDVRLARGSRVLEFNTTGAIVERRGASSESSSSSSSAASSSAVLHTAGFSASSITGHFGKGVVQARGKGGTMQFASNSSLPRLYALGEGSSIEIKRGSSGTNGVTILRSGDTSPLQFGLGGPGPRNVVATGAGPAPIATVGEPVSPAGFALVGAGSCLPNLPQWHSSDLNTTLAGCAMVCSNITLCLGFDWSAGSCHVRFPLSPGGLPPARFTAVAGSAATCGNITGATVRMHCLTHTEERAIAVCGLMMQYLHCLCTGWQRSLVLS